MLFLSSNLKVKIQNPFIMINKQASYVLILAVFNLIISCSAPIKNNQSIYQISTINALLEGYYDGETTIGSLKKKGNFGIGTFNNLDGELLAIDGTFYQIKSDGKVYLTNDSTKSPFAAVTNFKEDISKSITTPMNFHQLETFLDSILPGLNLMYAIKIYGEFDNIKTRSVARQQKPYQPLVEIVKTQDTFTFNKVSGTLVGFRLPEYMRGVNVPGYHFHFITEDKTKGGHLLDCTTKNINISIDSIRNFELSLPANEEFNQLQIGNKKKEELDKVER